LGADAVAVAELRRLAIAGGVAVALRLPHRFRAAVDVLETVDEGAGEAEERVRPVVPQLRGFAKRCDRVAELLGSRGGAVARFLGFAVDAMQVALTVAQRRSQAGVAGRDPQ